jgi:hypothetical protein
MNVVQSISTGSPVGRWAGYFLMQHKDQLGGNKLIYKARVFTSDGGDDPYMVFFVDGPAAPSGDEARVEVSFPHVWSGIDGGNDTRIVRRSEDGKSVVREHVFRARL